MRTANTYPFLETYFSKYLSAFSLIFVLFLVTSVCVGQNNQESTKDYELSTAPDLWFNSVDGIRAGIRLRGEVPGTFRSGPHRLDAGLWLGTFIPQYPVSYYVSFTEPIPSISGFNSEGNIRLRSSIRTGYHNHNVSFNKRWQPGFNEKNYRELSIGVGATKRFEDEYVLYPQIWQEKWLYLSEINAVIENSNPLGRYKLQSSTVINIAGEADQFISTRFNVDQHIQLNDNFILRTRIFAGVSSNNTAPEYLYTRSFKPYVQWDELGSTRAKGTLPTPWVRQGIVQVAGGANLRGYTNQDVELLNDGQAPVFNSFGAFNAELQYPNFVNKALKNIPLAGLLDFRTYLFFDSGTSLGFTSREESRLLFDAGLGFMLNLNIPDYLGKNRGFAIRYEVPLWLSNPNSGSSEFEYRSLIGIGAVISL